MKIPAWFPAAAGLLYAAVALAWLAWWRTRGRRRNVERVAAVRQQALARYYAGMPPGHPEQIGPLTAFEQDWLGGYYDHIRGQLADIDTDESREQT